MARKTYKVELTPSAARSIRKIERGAQVRIARAIDSLAETPRPHGAIKLSAADEIYRLRVGDYRILYQIIDKVLLVIVIAVGHRKEIYRR